MLILFVLRSADVGWCLLQAVARAAAGARCLRWRRGRRDERRGRAVCAAAVRRRSALLAALAAVRVPLAAPHALPHRWSAIPRGGCGRRVPVAQRRSSCARVVPRLHSPPRDAAARAGARPASEVGLGLSARAWRAEPSERV